MLQHTSHTHTRCLEDAAHTHTRNAMNNKARLKNSQRRRQRVYRDYFKMLPRKMVHHEMIKIKATREYKQFSFKLWVYI